MSTIKRTSFKLPSAGPFIARITSHLDPTFMGGVEAVLEEGTFTDPEQQKFVYPLRYLNPFYGAMSTDFEKADPTDYYDVQKSYGMSFVPPDVGTRVICLFVGNDSNQGFWIGCVQDTYQNHMIPGIAASSDVAWAPGQQEKYGVDYLPVAEFHKKKLVFPYKPNEQKKPVHPFADRLLAQGLLADRIRGVTSSSARREFPSAVFGISTPGPIDPNSKKSKIGYSDTGSTTAPTSRFAGHTFVMDDGDVTGSNKLVRLRTGGGHQVLLNDSANVVYIANATGTAWLEFTGNGKIDIYAADSVSIHSEQDFNFRADRDINIEALRNFNIKSAGNLTINSDKEFNVRTGENVKLYIDGDWNQYVKGNLNFTIDASANILAKAKLNLTSKGQVSLSTSGAFKVASAGKSFFGAPGNIAEPASSAMSETVKLKEWFVPRVSVGAGWPGGKRYQDGTIPSIMQRVPMHEPWPHHESTAPTNFTPSNTDSNNSSSAPNATLPAPPPNTSQPPNWAQDTEFLNKVKEVAKKYKMDYIDLLAIMMMESGIDPSRTNSRSGATGLIQFTTVALPSIGNPTLAQLRAMTRTQQMHYVDLYFSKSTPGLANMTSTTMNDIYMAVFAPFRGFGKPDSTILYSDTAEWLARFPERNRTFERRAYEQNSVLDRSGDRTITKAEACRLLPGKRAQVVRALGL
jgi:hypothetical protein